MDLTGCTARQLRAALAAGKPVAVWATIDMEQPRLTEEFTWRISGSGEEYHPYANLHCLLLVGYDAQSYYLLDPLTGLRQEARVVFEGRWTAMGCRAMVLDAGMDRAPYRTREEGEGRPDPARLTLPGRRGKALL